MRPRKAILIWAEDPIQASILVFALNTGQNVAAWAPSTETEFNYALQTIYKFHLVIILAGDKAGLATHRMAKAAMAAPTGIPVLSLANTVELAKSIPHTAFFKMEKNMAALFDWIKVLISRKRGPRKGVYHARRTIAPAAGPCNNSAIPSALA